MSELLTNDRVVEVNWKAFSFPLKHLKKHLKSQYENFDGLGANQSKLKIIFKETISEQLRQEVISYYNSIEEDTFAAEQLVDQTKLIGDKAEIFGQSLMSKFRGENIRMGITQAGKSGAILSIMVEKVDVNEDGFPISLKEAVETGTLYEALKLIDYHIEKSNNGDYDSIAPFMTEERLDRLKQEILSYLNE